MSDKNYFTKGFGEGYQRMNIACPKAVLEQAMMQLANAIKEI